jgi:hypothetical protein
MLVKSNFKKPPPEPGCGGHAVAATGPQGRRVRDEAKHQGVGEGGINRRINRRGGQKIASFDSFCGRFSLLAAVLAVLLTGSAAAQQPFVHPNDVAFLIKTDAKKYEIGENIVIFYTIKNVSNGALFVPRSRIFFA